MSRSPNDILHAVSVLDVRNNPLFLPGKLVVEPEIAPPPVALWNGQQVGVLPYTRCNGYAGVLLALLGCPIPWLTANKLFDWFDSTDAIVRGWQRCVLLDAINSANDGTPVVVVAKEDPHGHIGVAVPNALDLQHLYVSAAGAVNTMRASVAEQFGTLQPSLWKNVT